MARINWDYIEPLYRVGNLSNYEIAAQYAENHKSSKTWKPTVTEAAIRKQAKAKGWLKNLANKVKERVKENLVRDQVRSANQTDDEIITQAAEVGSGVIRRHREEIFALIDHENRLLNELAENPTKVHISSYQGDITETTLNLTVTEKATTLKALADVRDKRISLERKAYNLDEEPVDNSELLKSILLALPDSVRPMVESELLKKAGK